MSTAKMAKMLENTEDWDPITPQVIQSIFKNDSRAMESLGKRWNIPQLEQDAKYNQQNPEEGIANASKATGMAFLGNWLGGAAGAGNGGGYVDQIGNAYEGAVAGQATQPWYQAAMQQANTPQMRRYLMNQGMDMMNQQPMQAPQHTFQPPQQPTQDMQSMTPYMDEETKRRLREQGYLIY